MQAIRTRYYVDKNGNSRISAKAEAGLIQCDWDSNRNSEENHRIAARWYCQKMNWKGVLVSGVFGGDHYHVFK